LPSFEEGSDWNGCKLYGHYVCITPSRLQSRQQHCRETMCRTSNNTTSPTSTTCRTKYPTSDNITIVD
jgi:hypothetical protein